MYPAPWCCITDLRGGENGSGRRGRPFIQASQWLTKRKRWRMEETTWSVHKECKRLDRAGRGNSMKFWYTTHEGLVETVEWEMSNNTYIISAGKPWT